MGDLSQNFSRREFRCKCQGCDEDHISLELVEALEKVRVLYGRAIYITSGVRCKEHNKICGGKSDSSHLTGYAVDIGCANSTQRYRLVSLLVNYFNRVGIGQDFIHIDLDPNKNKEVMWLY